MARPPHEPTTVACVLADARQRLARAPFRPSTREAALLLGYVLGLSEAQVLARGPEPLPAGAESELESLLARRLAGEPVAYLRGEKEFYGRPFFVDARVLIPRPETEHLVEAALDLPLPPAPFVLDLGTGSGCIAVTLAVERPRLRAVAADLSPAALALAARNARRHGVGDRIHLVATDFASALDLHRIDLVISNPPYIDPRHRDLLSPEVSGYEPGPALFSPREPIELLVSLLQGAASLRQDAPVVLELGDGQAQELGRRLGGTPCELVELRRDYAGRERVAVLRRRRIGDNATGTGSASR